MLMLCVHMCIHVNIRGVRRGVSGVSGNPPPDSESLTFYVLAMQTLLRKAEIIFHTVALRCVVDVRSQCFRLP